MRRFLTLHNPAETRAYYDAGLWRTDTFYSLLADHARVSPNRVALTAGDLDVSWRGLKARVDGAAMAFRSESLVAGDRVSIWMSNRIEAVVTFLACSREGYACNPSLHRSYTTAEINTLLARLSTRILVTEAGWGADGAEIGLGPTGPALLRIFRPEDFPMPGETPHPADSDPDRVTYLAFTSGTTGAPKCVMHSANTLLANARNLVADWNIGEDISLACLSPLSHHIGWVAVAQWLLSGCRLLISETGGGARNLEWILSSGATYVMGVPTHAIDILAEQRRRGLTQLGEVETFYMAGSPIPPAVADAFQAQGITPQNVYGMTENSSHQYTHPHDDPRTIISTCGRGGSAYEVRVFKTDNPNLEAERGEVGQIGGRGAALMLGYLGDQDATEASFNRGGWFMSGDLGVLDTHGCLSIEGRLKDLIIRGGHNIYPSQIEALAMRHRRVEKVACFPIADERLGERVCIAVIGDVEADDLLDHLRHAGLSKYDMPEYFLRMRSFPLTASGKILKRSLTEMVREGQISPVFLRTKAGVSHAHQA